MSRSNTKARIPSNRARSSRARKLYRTETTDFSAWVESLHTPTHIDAVLGLLSLGVAKCRGVGGWAIPEEVDFGR